MPLVTAAADEQVSRPLRIAMVTPPYFTVPPEGYGGVESVVAGLVDGLVERGHHVTLLGAGEHGTRAQRFVGLWDDLPTAQIGQSLPEAVHAARVGSVIGSGADFDLVHDHTLTSPLLAAGRLVPTVVTVHGPMFDLADLYRPLGRCRQPGRDLGRPAQIGARPELGRHRPQRHRRGELPVPPPQGRLRPVPRALPPDEGSPPGDRRGTRGRCPDPARGQVRRTARTGVLRRGGRASTRAGCRRRRGRRRRGEASAARRCARPRLPHPLGGALRHGAHRGHGVRDAGRRPDAGIGPRGGRARSHRRGRGATRRSSPGRSTSRRASIPPTAAAAPRPGSASRR